MNLYALGEILDNPTNLRLVQAQSAGPIGGHGVITQIASSWVALPMAEHRERGVVVQRRPLDRQSTSIEVNKRQNRKKKGHFR